MLVSHCLRLQLLKKAALSQLANSISPAESLRLALLQVSVLVGFFLSDGRRLGKSNNTPPSLYQGEEVSVKELDSLMLLISEKKRKAEQEEAEANMEILLAFLNKSAQQKQQELEEVGTYFPAPISVP